MEGALLSTGSHLVGSGARHRAPPARQHQPPTPGSQRDAVTVQPPEQNEVNPLLKHGGFLRTRDGVHLYGRHAVLLARRHMAVGAWHCRDRQLHHNAPGAGGTAI